MHHGAAHWAAVRTGMAVRRAQPQLALTIRCEAFREIDAMKRTLSLLWHDVRMLPAGLSTAKWRDGLAELSGYSV
jgi:hypothetical protein